MSKYTLLKIKQDLFLSIESHFICSLIYSLFAFYLLFSGFSFSRFDLLLYFYFFACLGSLSHSLCLLREAFEVEKVEALISALELEEVNI